MEIQVANATAQVDITSGFVMELPVSGDFCNVDLTRVDLQEVHDKIEK